MVAFLTPCRASAVLFKKALGQMPGRTFQVTEVYDNKPASFGSAGRENSRVSPLLQVLEGHPAVVAPSDVQDRQAGDSRGKGAPALAPKKT